MSGEMEGYTNELREFLFEFLYFSGKSKLDEKKITTVIRMLWNHYMENPDELPEEYRQSISQWGEKQVVIDYIAGMSDGYALRKFNELFIPKSWL
jgi:dGTPase